MMLDVLGIWLIYKGYKRFKRRGSAKQRPMKVVAKTPRLRDELKAIFLEVK